MSDYINTHTHISDYINTHTHMSDYINTHTHMSDYINTHTHMSDYINTHTHMSDYINIHTHITTSRKITIFRLTGLFFLKCFQNTCLQTKGMWGGFVLLGEDQALLAVISSSLMTLEASSPSLNLFKLPPCHLAERVNMLIIAKFAACIWFARRSLYMKRI